MTPILNAIDAGCQIEKFTFRNARALLMPILPYAILIEFLAVIAPTESWVGTISSAILALANFYLYAIFAIECHRTFLLNTPPGQTLNPMKPMKQTLPFSGYLFLIFSLFVILGVSFPLTATLLSPAGSETTAKIALLILFILGALAAFIYYGTRFSFILPDRAIGGRMKWRDVFAISKGLFWKIMIAQFFATWKVFLTVGVCIFVFSTIGIRLIINFPISLFVEQNQLLSKIIFFMLFDLPLIPVSYLVTAMTVMVLSNYYQLGKDRENAFKAGTINPIP